MNTKLEALGQSTLEVEVTNISIHGFWLLIADNEYYLAFTNFPWFKNATIAAIQNVQLLNPCHLYWPVLDVDLDLDCVLHPENYPLVYKS